MMEQIKAQATRLMKDRKGNFAIITAFVMLPLMGMVGMAVDIAQMTSARTKLQVDLDAATLSSANKLAKGTAAEVKTEFETALKARASQGGSYKLGGFDVAVDTANNLVTSTASGTIQTSFLRLIGMKTVQISTAAQAKSGQDKYFEISFILDKSASMLLAATTTDQSKMQKLSLNCVFACHDTRYAETYQGAYYSSYYAYARAKGVLLRADVQAQAVTALMDTIDEVDPKHNRVKINLFTLGTNTNADGVLKGGYNTADGIRRTYGPTYDTSEIRKQMTTNKELTSETSYLTTDYRALSALDTYLTTSGDGTSAAKPLKVVILITDGVQSSADWVFFGKPYITPMNPAWCSNVKKLGATFSVLYTEYLPWTNRSEYNDTVGNTMGSSNFKTVWGGTIPSPSTISRHDYISTALTNCATSPEYFLSAANPTDIKSGLKALVGKSLEGIRLTQ